jgi:hypothetical protein
MRLDEAASEASDLVTVALCSIANFNPAACATAGPSAVNEGVSAFVHIEPVLRDLPPSDPKGCLFNVLCAFEPIEKARDHAGNQIRG